MSYDFDTVINGIIRYIEKFIFPTLNKTQLFVGYTLLTRYRRNLSALRPMLEDNALLKPLRVFDDDGRVDIDSWMEDIKSTMEHYGKFELEIPFVGPYSFTKDDVDKLCQCIREV